MWDVGFWRADDSEDDGRMTPKCEKPEDDTEGDCRMTAAWSTWGGWVTEDEDEDEEDWPGAGGRLQAPTRGQYTLGEDGSHFFKR